MSPTLTAGDLVLCRGSIRRCGLDELADAAVAAGFPGVSLYVDDLDGDPRRVRRILDDRGLAVAELDGASRWLPGDTRGPDVAEMLDAAAEVGARSVTVLALWGSTVGSDVSWPDAVDAFGAVCDRAATLGLLVHLEFFPTSGLDTFAAAATLVALAGRPNGGVLLDTWHYLRGGDAGQWPAGVPGEMVIGVQLGDIAPQPSPDVRHEMMHDRRVPGTGAGHLHEIVGDLVARGCRAPFGVEVFSDELAGLPPVEVATRLRRSLDSILPAHG
jgi:sugar phosphate isomerase/epimerase